MVHSLEIATIIFGVLEDQRVRNTGKIDVVSVWATPSCRTYRLTTRTITLTLNEWRDLITCPIVLELGGLVTPSAKADEKDDGLQS
jgi:hypothetical protein